MQAFLAFLSSALPATVVVAVAIFIAREVLEFLRRRRSDARKLQAIKHLVAREAQVNYFVATTLRHCMDLMSEWVEDKQRVTLDVRTDPAGHHHLTRTRDDDSESGTPVPDPQDAMLGKYLLDIAILNRELFAAAEKALDQVAEMRHVKGSLLDYILDDGEREAWHVDGFPDYGRREIEDSQEALKKLYRECTGQELKLGRPR